MTSPCGLTFAYASQLLRKPLQCPPVIQVALEAIIDLAWSFVNIEIGMKDRFRTLTFGDKEPI